MSSFSQIYNSLLVPILTAQFSTIFFAEATVAGDNTYKALVDMWFEVM